MAEAGVGAAYGAVGGATGGGITEIAPGELA